MILNESYDLLSNPQTRAEYDEQALLEFGISNSPNRHLKISRRSSHSPKVLSPNCVSISHEPSTTSVSIGAKTRGSKKMGVRNR